MMAIKQVPLEKMIKIMEKLKFKDAVKLCEDLKISEELAYQYHKFDKRYHSSLWSKIYDYRKRKILNPNLAKAVLKNSRFQSRACAGEKVAFAILSQDLDLVRDALQDPKVDHDDKRNNPLRIVCEYGQLDVVKLLLNEYGINISAHDNTALFAACRKGHARIVKYILSHPDFNPHDVSKAFLSPSVWTHADVIRLLLLDPRFDPSYQNNQAIINAAENGQIKIVERLMSDPRVNPADQNNETIKLANLNGHAEILHILRKDPTVAKLWAITHRS
jgi:ankyrin repeat protein